MFVTKAWNYNQFQSIAYRTSPMLSTWIRLSFKQFHYHLKRPKMKLFNLVQLQNSLVSWVHEVWFNGSISKCLHQQSVNQNRWQWHNYKWRFTMRISHNHFDWWTFSSTVHCLECKLWQFNNHISNRKSQFTSKSWPNTWFFKKQKKWFCKLKSTRVFALRF